MTRLLAVCLAFALAFPVLKAAAETLQEREEALYTLIEALHGDAGGFLVTATRISQAMAAGDHEAVAAEVAYPIAVEANGEVYDIFEAKNLVDNFDALVPDTTRRVVGGFMLGDVTVDETAVSFGGGAMWMAPACRTKGCSNTVWSIIRLSDVPGTDAVQAASEPSGFPVEAGSWGGKVRSGPGMEHAQIASLRQGEPLTLLARTEIVFNDYPWFRIRTSDGLEGYQWGGVVCARGVAVEGAFETCP